jgi:hypothetical protein
VERELNKIKPILELFDTNGEFLHNKWKRFKENYNVTWATM